MKIKIIRANGKSCILKIDDFKILNVMTENFDNWEYIAWNFIVHAVKPV